VAEDLRTNALLHTPGGQASKQEGVDDPVTLGDLGAQAVALYFLRSSFPGDLVLAEESSSALARMDDGPRQYLCAVVAKALAKDDLGEEELAGLLDWRGPAASTGERIWVLDPVDGTKGYRDGFSYSLALGLCLKARPHLGVIAAPTIRAEGGAPERPLIFWAVRGEGAWSEPFGGRGRMIQARVRPAVPREALLAVGSRANYDQAGPRKVLAGLGIDGDRYLLYDSQVKYALLALNRASVYIRPPHGSGRGENVWDHAAGSLIAQEAGGVVTDLDGKELDFGGLKQGSTRLEANRGVLATAGIDHARVLGLCREARL
jgi:3'(2'), 5'-bisphosphate nucleotidase